MRGAHISARVPNVTKRIPAAGVLGALGEVVVFERDAVHRRLDRGIEQFHDQHKKHGADQQRALDARRPIRTVQDLVAALSGVRLPERRHHPATLVFQALRMAVNDELAELDAGLESALESLAQGGRLAVLSYHSGEDRRVKQFMAREAKGCICPPDLPVCGCGQVPRLRIVARGTKPSPGEIRRNPRARSARLRGGERC